MAARLPKVSATYTPGHDRPRVEQRHPQLRRPSRRARAGLRRRAPRAGPRVFRTDGRTACVVPELHERLDVAAHVPTRNTPAGSRSRSRTPRARARRAQPRSGACRPTPRRTAIWRPKLGRLQGRRTRQPSVPGEPARWTSEARESGSGYGSSRRRRRPRIESRKDVKKISPPTAISVAPRIATRVSLSTPKPCAAQRPNTTAKSTTPVTTTIAARRSPCSSRNRARSRSKRFVLVADEVGAVGTRAETEADRLHAEQDQEAAEDQGVDVEAAPEDRYLHEDEQRDERCPRRA